MSTAVPNPFDDIVDDTKPAPGNPRNPTLFAGPAIINPQGPCRQRGHESDLRGRCMRCGFELGTPCPEESA